MKWIVNSDLDNTLIYSYKREIGKEKICVEIYHEREISFMTPKSYQLLKDFREKEEICFVPTTTRTMQQFQRIQFGGDQPMEYALVSNGGILLKNGVPDSKWYQDSLSMIEGSKEEFEKAEEILKKDENRSFDIRLIDELFLFTKSSEPEKSVEMLSASLDLEKVKVLHNREKVFVLPKELNKGNAVLRLKEYLKYDRICAAGDSKFDLPMLFASDVAFFPEELKDTFEKEKNRHALRKDFRWESIKHDSEPFSNLWMEKFLKEYLIP